MITLLADYDIEGQAALLWAAVAASGWLDTIPMRMFASARLALHPRAVIVSDENKPDLLPVMTISRIDHVFERSYREACVERLLEIVVYLQDYRGVGRVFIP